MSVNDLGHTLDARGTISIWTLNTTPKESEEDGKATARAPERLQPFISLEQRTRRNRDIKKTHASVVTHFPQNPPKGRRLAKKWRLGQSALSALCGGPHMACWRLFRGGSCLDPRRYGRINKHCFMVVNSSSTQACERDSSHRSRIMPE